MEKDLKTLHHWKVLALSCIDGRFVKRTIDWVSSKTDGVFDFRTEFGLSKAIIDSLPDRERLFELISVSIRLHNIEEIWLIDHVDCGAYGGSKMFADNIAEAEFHNGQLEKAAKVIEEKFPELKVKKIFEEWEGFQELN